MSTKGDVVLGKGLGERVPVSVFDFLYCDNARIGSFLSQFDDNGLLTGIRQSDSAAKGARQGWKLGVGADVPLAGGGNLSVERTPLEGGSETLERSYDPYWANAREFLDALEAHSLINRDLAATPLGEFALVSGSLWIVDTSLVHLLYAKEGFAGAAITKAAERTQGEFDYGIAQMKLELVSTIPAQTQFYLQTESERVWSTLRPDGLVTPPTEIAAKHGIAVDGQWHVLGIKDAAPTFDKPEDRLADFEKLKASQLRSSYMMDAFDIGRLTRDLFGRPSDCYGVTPLLIFRNVRT